MCCQAEWEALKSEGSPSAERFAKCMQVQGLLYDQHSSEPYICQSGGTQLLAHSTTCAGMFNDARGIAGLRNNLTVRANGVLACAELQSVWFVW
jgi:hypothetical protein